MNKASKNNAILMDNLVPSEFYLSQNYPNPFKYSTKIKYCLPERTKVNLTLFSSDGKKMKELVNEIQEAGTYKVKLNGCDLQAGDYYYRILAVDPITGTKELFVEMKEMILLRENENLNKN